jgi:hypothetical protein
MRLERQRRVARNRRRELGGTARNLYVSDLSKIIYVAADRQHAGERTGCVTT